MILELVIPIVINGYANAIILKYKTANLIISGDFVKIGIIISLKNKKKILKLKEIPTARDKPYLIIL